MTTFSPGSSLADAALVVPLPLLESLSVSSGSLLRAAGDERARRRRAAPVTSREPAALGGAGHDCSFLTVREWWCWACVLVRSVAV